MLALVKRLAPVALRARLAAVVGAVLLALAAVAFARAGNAATAAFDGLWRARPWLAAALPPIVFVAITAITRRWFPEARGSGIPQVMAAGHNPAQAADSPLVSLRSAAAKFVGTVLMMAAGASTGREGPTVQVSAAIVAAVHRWLRVPITAGVLIAGGAAGVAAAFNTPLAGVAFAIEELASAFEQKVAVLVMATVMVAGLVSVGLSGDYVYFGLMTQTLPIPAMLVAAPLAGVLGGAFGGAFARLMIAQGESRHPVMLALRARPLVWALLCGLVVSATALLTNGLSWGTGIETTRGMLSGQGGSLAFGPAKFVATLATSVCGAPGGIFAPSLAAGAGLGQAIALLFPEDSAGAIVLLGMAGYFAGVVRAPLTAVIIMSEMTASRAMILPLFAAALIGDAASALVCPQKLYHALSRPFRRPE